MKLLKQGTYVNDGIIAFPCETILTLAIITINNCYDESLLHF